MYPVPIPLAGFDIGQETVPDEAVDLRKHDPGFGAVSVEQAQLDPLGHLAEQREVRPGSVVGRPQRVRPTRPYLGNNGGGRAMASSSRSVGHIGDALVVVHTTT